jgi:hypothetical protein
MDLPLDTDFGIDGAPYPSYLLDEDQIILSQPVLVLEDMFVSEVPRCRDKILRMKRVESLARRAWKKRQRSKW